MTGFDVLALALIFMLFSTIACAISGKLLESLVCFIIAILLCLAVKVEQVEQNKLHKQPTAAELSAHYAALRASREAEAARNADMTCWCEE